MPVHVGGVYLCACVYLTHALELKRFLLRGREELSDREREKEEERKTERENERLAEWAHVCVSQNDCCTCMPLPGLFTLFFDNILCDDTLFDMGWLRLVGSSKFQVFLAEYSLFCRALLQKRPMILRSLLIVATP